MTASYCYFSHNVCPDPLATDQHSSTHCFSIHFQHLDTDVHCGRQWKAGSFTAQHSLTATVCSLVWHISGRVCVAEQIGTVEFECACLCP